MGNSSSSSGRHQDDTVDYGFLVPQGVYTGQRDWNQAIVSQLIVARKLAPFYRPLEEYDESWDDEQVLAARRELPDPESADTITRIEATHANASKSSHHKRSNVPKEPNKADSAIYKGAVECPICFLYYPSNINHSRCCDQAICTECFVQIKRSEPTATHLVSEPAACPYCVQDNFGIVYAPPLWRAGIGSEGTAPLWSDLPRTYPTIENATAAPTHKRRQKSFGADSPEVVTTDHIRPDWEAKLQAVRAAVTRRANRRIIMRQVGDRLIPVGVTSGRVHALSPEEASVEGVDTGSRRSRRRQQAQQNSQFEQFMGMGGQDLEELMLMEAMRLSLLDHEEHQRKEAEEKKKQEAAAAASQEEADPNPESTATSVPGPSTLEARSSIQTARSTNLSPSPLAVSSSSAHQSGGPYASRSSRSPSRSHSPSAFITSAPSVSQSDSSISGWPSRTTDPPPFSTLNVALASASTAAAFLGAPRENGSSDNSAHNITPSFEANRSSSDTIPTITVDTTHPVVSIPFIDTTTTSTLSGDNSAHTGSSSVLNSASSIFSEDESGSGVSSYGQLPSSPESEFTHEPLLGPESMHKHDEQVITSSASTSG